MTLFVIAGAFAAAVFRRGLLASGGSLFSSNKNGNRPVTLEGTSGGLETTTGKILSAKP